MLILIGIVQLLPTNRHRLSQAIEMKEVQFRVTDQSRLRKGHQIEFNQLHGILNHEVNQYLSHHKEGNPVVYNLLKEVLRQEKNQVQYQEEVDRIAR
jgi:hypothetical protein